MEKLKLQELSKLKELVEELEYVIKHDDVGITWELEDLMLQAKEILEKEE